MYARPLLLATGLLCALVVLVAAKLETFEVELAPKLTWAPQCPGKHAKGVPKLALRLSPKAFKPEMCGKKLKIHNGADGVIVGPADKIGEIEVTPALYKELKQRKKVLAAVPK